MSDSECYAQTIIDDLKEELNELQDECNAVFKSYEFQYQRANDLREELKEAQLEIVRLQTIIDKFEATIEAEDGL